MSEGSALRQAKMILNRIVDRPGPRWSHAAVSGTSE